MKVVIFAGGYGTRMREQTEFIPKPMVRVGGRPVLWHLLQIYSRQGFREFVILAGYRAEAIRAYFSSLNREAESFTVQTLTGEMELHSPLPDWKVTILDTGVATPTGDRLLKARETIGEHPFLCTYGDGLANVDLSSLQHEASKAPEGSSVMTAAVPQSRFGSIEVDSSGFVTSFNEKTASKEFVNIGYFLFTNAVFSHITPGTMLEDSALPALAKSRQLRVNRHKGFWMPMDTQREYEELCRLWESGDPPWFEDLGS